MTARLASPRRPRGPHSPRTLRPAALVASAAVCAAGACGGRDLFAPNPANNIDTQAGDLTVFPLGSATGPLGTAANLYDLAVVRPALTTIQTTLGPASTPNFDFAVDRDTAGTVRLLPSRVVVDLTGVGQPRTVGFQTTRTPFDSIVEAPTNGYRVDSAFTVAVGQPVLVQAQALGCVNRTTNTTYYAKLVVVSAEPGAPITIRARVNPNCTFRSLRPGRG